MINNKKAAMEMSIGTVVTIVLLMTVLVLGLVLVQKIFGGATDNIDEINDQVRSQINDLFNVEEKEVIVALGTKQTANVKRGTEDFGFVFAYQPDEPDKLNGAKYDIEVADGDKYCKGKNSMSDNEIEDWFISNINNAPFDEIEKSVTAIALVKLSVPDEMSPCVQRFYIKINKGSTLLHQTYFDINVKKGFI